MMPFASWPFIRKIKLRLLNNMIKKDETTQDMTDSFEIVGIDKDGYGKVSKCLMLDTTIDPSAKGLFAYYAAHTANGKGYSFPSREKITRDLKISFRTMYKYRGQLEERGYIKVQEIHDSAHKQKTNHYIINMCPDTVMEEQNKISHAKSLSLRGWGNMPRMVVMDKSLGLKAIGLYGYISALAGSNNFAIIKTDYQKLTFGLNDEPYYQQMRKLVDNGYIVRYQLHVNGSIRGSVYELTDHKLSEEEIKREKKNSVRVLSEEECLEMFGNPGFIDLGIKSTNETTSKHEVPEKSTTAEPLKNKDFYEVPEKSTTAFLDDSAHEEPDFETTHFETTHFETTQKGTSNNNKIKINKLKNNNLITPSLSEEKRVKKAALVKNYVRSLFGENVDNYKDALSVLKKQSDYQLWAGKDSNLDLAVEILARMVTASEPFEAKGYMVTSDDVIQKLTDRLTEYHDLTKLDIADMLCSFAGKMAESVSKDRNPIPYRSSYMKSIIYDSLLGNTISVDHISDPMIRSIYESKLKNFEKKTNTA